ncbi:hypothetical protein LJB42_001471 [Komagataella kurtzmanii]|nr:hypothetical protein LJB42_001471 [Komagataella kurtzmanii]
MTNSDVQHLKQQIQDVLVESGKYDELSNFLRSKLYQVGWTDEINRLAQSIVTNEAKPTFSNVIERIEPKAMDIVPEHIKTEILAKIEEFLKDVVPK